MSKISTQMRFDEALYLKTKEIAKEELRSINGQIEYFIKRGVEKYEDEYGTVYIGEEFDDADEDE